MEESAATDKCSPAPSAMADGFPGGKLGRPDARRGAIFTSFTWGLGEFYFRCWGDEWDARDTGLGWGYEVKGDGRRGRLCVILGWSTSGSMGRKRISDRGLWVYM